MSNFIILVRHGESENNILSNRKKRKKDPLLTNQGVAQIIDSVNYIDSIYNNKKFCIWTSPFKRTIQSSLIASKLMDNIEINIIKELHEVEGFIDIDPTDPSKYFSVDSPTYEELVSYNDRKISHKYNNSENWWHRLEIDNIEKRIDKLFKIFLSSKDINVLAFTHGDLIRNIYMKIYKEDYIGKIPNVSRHLLAYDKLTTTFSIKQI
jgi:broad specificity phosphatase PhoE